MNIIPPYNILNDPEITLQLRENYQNNQLKNEIAQTNNAEYMAKVIGQRIVDFQSTLSEVQDVALQIIQLPFM